MSNIRVRIAPSPSGFLHIGTAKTALVNWLFARQSGGTFILRLEDTDAERTEDEFAEAMCEGFRWLGIDWDEGPEFGGVSEKGDSGPYRQSQRTELHQKEANRLLEEGKAYKCFCTREELDAEREKAKAEKRAQIGYNGNCRNLTPDEIVAKGDAPFAIRFKVPEGFTEVHDMVQGVVRTDNKEFDDFIIVRPTGAPVFHLAVVVDDGTMGITHVIRGDDHLTNGARHVMLFDALGYTIPKFAHLPMVLDEHGKKYSKRLHGANVLDWRDDGYLPETIINYVALLGWNPGDDRELFTRDELVKEFSADRLTKSAAKFDLKKLQWLNGQHIRMLPLDDLRERLVGILRGAGLDTGTKSEEWLTRLAEICQEKLKTLNEIPILTDFFFVEPDEYEEKAVKKQWRKEGALEKLQQIERTMYAIDEWNHDALKEAFEVMAAEAQVGFGQFIHPTRLALTGKSVGPGLFELAELLGKDTCLKRIAKAKDFVRHMEETSQ